MEELAQHLNEIDTCGSYRLGCPVEALREAVEQAEFKLFEVDLQDVSGKEELITAIAQAAEFYEGFPANWDALQDSLCDLSAHIAPGYVFLFLNADPDLGLSEDEQATVESIFVETVEFWQIQRRAFWVFFA
jgi:hypothetical protein